MRTQSVRRAGVQEQGHRRYVGPVLIFIRSVHAAVVVSSRDKRVVGAFDLGGEITKAQDGGRHPWMMHAHPRTL